VSRFDGEVVLVTGASRGIGAATAKAFAAEGARVAINYRQDREGATATQQAITAAAGEAIVVRADMAVDADIVSLMTEIEDRLDPVTVLVNNAAMIDRSSFLEVDLDAFEQVWRVNVRGVFRISQLVAQHMVDNGVKGVIIHLSSILARLAVNNRTAYIASKGAIEGLTRSMSLDLAAHGIRVNAVAPGLIATEALLAGMPDVELQKAIQSHIPKARFGRPEEIAAAILFVASDDAGYVNGAIIPVDAGLGGREAGPSTFQPQPPSGDPRGPSHDQYQP